MRCQVRFLSDAALVFGDRSTADASDPWFALANCSYARDAEGDESPVAFTSFPQWGHTADTSPGSPGTIRSRPQYSQRSKELMKTSPRSGLKSDSETLRREFSDKSSRARRAQFP